MRILGNLLLIASLALPFGGAFAFQGIMEGEEIHGRWLWTGMLVEGQIKPPPNPALKIFYEFRPDGTATLKWSRDNEPGFCERRSTYFVREQLIFEKIEWIHPDNAGECSRDPDMQLGREVQTPFSMDGGDLVIFMNLGDNQLATYWSRQ